MSYKLDLIVSDIPASHLVKLEDDDYFPRGDDKSLAQKIEERLKFPKKREYLLKEYDWKIIATKTVAIYREAIR